MPAAWLAELPAAHQVSTLKKKLDEDLDVAGRSTNFFLPSAQDLVLEWVSMSANNSIEASAFAKRSCASGTTEDGELDLGLGHTSDVRHPWLAYSSARAAAAAPGERGERTRRSSAVPLYTSGHL